MSIRTMRYIALVEATTFLALLVATYVKYAAGEPIGVRILGPIHGILFIAYVLMTFKIRRPAGLGTRTTLGVLLGAVVPFGGYLVDRWLVTSTRNRDTPQVHDAHPRADHTAD